MHLGFPVCCSGNLGWKEGNITFAWCLPHTGSPQSSGNPVHCPSPQGGETGAEKHRSRSHTCPGHRGALRLSQPFFSHLLLSPCLIWAIVGAKDLNPMWDSVAGLVPTEQSSSLWFELRQGSLVAGQSGMTREGCQ